MTNEAPEVEQRLVDFGNTAKAIPYYAVFRPGKEPLHFDGNFFTVGAKGFLERAGIDASAGEIELNKVKGEDQPAAKLDQLPSAVASPAG